jgi:predicted homoserine dehydrogenase-like protein
MIIVDTALQAREAEGRPIRVGMIGAGFMVRGLANQIINSVPGMRVVAIYNRNIDKAVSAYTYVSEELRPTIASTQAALDDAIIRQQPVVTEDAFLLARSEQIDVLVEATGSVEFGARVILEAFKHGKDVVLLNAEVDATIGPILQVYAKQYGVVLSACDGDEPGVQMNLVRWVRGLGLIPRVVGNIKGLPRSGARTPRWSPALRMARKSASNRPSWPTRPGLSSSRGACLEASSIATT